MKISKKQMIIVILAATVAAAVLTLFILIGRYQRSRVDLGKYITVTFTGANTVGKAKTNIDVDGVYTAICEATGKKQNEADSLNAAIASLSDGTADLAYGIEANLDKADGLSNDDTVVARITYNNEEAKSCGVRFYDTEVKFTVSGLKNLTQIDPFADIELKYSGYAPKAKVQIENNTTNTLLKSAVYKADKTDSIDIGDVITITINVDEAKAEEQGYTLTSVSKEYTVGTLDKYVTSISEISDDTLAAMKKETSDIVEAYIAGNYSKTTQTSDLQYVGTYLQILKDWKQPSYGLEGNWIYIVFSATINSTENAFSQQTVYYPVRFSQLVQLSTGTQLYGSASEIQGTTFLSDKGFVYTDGYTDGKDMFKECIVAEKDNYTYEMTDGLKTFGE
ncbi:MAG TPA: hypothetical protein PLN48_11245 [Lachnospiraceae bacterium]|nr:hypothetical protein [Lachnospiraceae bacterium]